MRLIWKILLIVIISLWAFPRVAMANELEGHAIFYNEDFTKIKIPVKGSTTEEVIYGIILEMDNNKEYLDFLQGETKLSVYSFKDGHLIVDFTKDVLSFGGSSNEYYMTETILESFLSVEAVTRVSFYIDGKLSPFCEGTVVSMGE